VSLTGCTIAAPTTNIIHQQLAKAYSITVRTVREGAACAAALQCGLMLGVCKWEWAGANAGQLTKLFLPSRMGV
jgi:hypothetical protein